ncbi:MAG: hypothetical protein IJ760_00635 [Bacteroidales bacterium]|nr:hypothetical protein [Bacteroidales bacterium]
MTGRCFHYCVLLVAALAAFASCTKDKPAEGRGLVLGTEKFAGQQKTAVAADKVYWVDGDRVLLNNQEYAVTLDGGVAYAEGFSGSGTVYGFYPAGTFLSHATLGQPAIVFPRTFSSWFADGRQVIALPMAAMGDADEGTIVFRHISAAVCVRVRNSMGHDIMLDSVVVASATQQLNTAARRINLGAADLGLTPASSTKESERRVSVLFDGAGLVAGSVTDVQVPILPIAAGDITISIFTHTAEAGVHGDVVRTVFTHTAAMPALGRNVMATAQVDFRADNERVRDVYAFSVEAGRQVYFSKGNLYYTIADGKWAFQEDQSTVVETGNVAADYSGAEKVGLFGWGTNGFPIEGRVTDPVSTSAEDTFGPDGESLDENTDWGRNPIVNGGNKPNRWRTLTSKEWQYILSVRTGATVGSNSGVHYCKVKVGSSICGIIIFPDNFIDPGVVSFSKSNLDKAGVPFASTALTTDELRQLEDCGVVFLPNTGLRNGNGFVNDSFCYYWSASQTDGKPRALRVEASTSNPSFSYDNHFGFGVRLVMDKE